MRTRLVTIGVDDPDSEARWLIEEVSGMDAAEQVLARATRALGGGLSRIGDQMIIDGAIVNGSARLVGAISGVVRNLQSGYLYHYAFAMVIGLALLAGWMILGR